MTENTLAPRPAGEIANMFGGQEAPQLPVNAQLPTISIMREAPKFEMPDGEITESFIGHIIYYTNTNQYYDKDFSPEESGPPVCCSSNGLSPDGPDGSPPGPYSRDESTGEVFPGVGKSCTTCWNNQYESAMKGRGKACQNTMRLWVLPEGSIIPALLKAPPTSLAVKGMLMKWLTNAPNIATKAGFGYNYQPIKVRFTLHTERYESGSASILDLTTDRVLDANGDEDRRLITKLGVMYRDFMVNHFPVIADAVGGGDVATDDSPFVPEGA